MADGRRYRRPDVLVVREWRNGRPMDPRNVVMVCEVISPGGDDRGEKMTAYADADIEWYLIVEETAEGFLGELYRLGDNGQYDLIVKSPPGGVLALPAPFDGDIELRTLS